MTEKKKTGPRAIKTPQSKWDDIRDLYVRGEWVEGSRYAYSKNELVKKFKVCRATLYKKALEEKWDSQMLTYQLELRDASDKKYIDMRLKQAFKFDQKCFDNANKNVDRIQRMIVEAEPKDLPALAASLEKMQKVARLARGDETDIVKNVTNEKGEDSNERFNARLAEFRALRQGGKKVQDGLGDEGEGQTTSPGGDR